jgi:hypothetical protein
MKRRDLFLLVFSLCFLLVYTGAFAQAPVRTGGIRTNYTVYHYSFTGANSLQEVDSLSTEIYRIPEVAQFKASFKPGNRHAEITLLVVEKFLGPESPETFDAVKLKVIILNHGYSPLSLTYYCLDHL